MQVRTAQELKPEDTVTNILTGSTVNHANLLQYMIYENPCAPKVSKSKISNALIGLRRGSLTDKARKQVAKAIFGVLDERVLPQEWLILPKNLSWAEKSGLVIWKDNRYWPCKCWSSAVEEANNLVWVKDGSRQYYSSGLLIKDKSFHYDPVTKALEQKAKSSSTEVKHRFSASQDAYLQKQRGGYEERSKSEPADPRAGAKPSGSRVWLSRAQSVTPGEGSGTPPRFQDISPEPSGLEGHVSDDSEVFESPESEQETSGETSVECTVSEGSGSEDSSKDRSPGPVQKGASAGRSEKVNTALEHQLSAAEESEEELTRLVTPEYSQAQVQTLPELQKAVELSKPQIKQHKADPIALTSGANCRESDIAVPEETMTNQNQNARQMLMLQDAARLPKFDADKTTDPTAFKSQTEAAWRLLSSCSLPPNASDAEAK